MHEYEDAVMWAVTLCSLLCPCQLLAVSSVIMEE
jgi:hypothetical protein